MTATANGRGAASALYRAVWRWHFYAGLLVLPLLVLLAVTGALYLFKDEINDALHSDLLKVPPRAEATLPPSALAAAALAAHPGTLTAYLPPAAPDRAARVKIRGAEGTDTVFLNPWTAQVLGSAWDAGLAGSRAMWVVRKLHSLDYVGWWGTRLIEAAAGWAILLVVSGAYLWWPRGRAVGTFAPRRARGRALWRDLHAVTGAYAGIFILFLALTGLPWSGVWGAKFYDWSYALGLGIPDGWWDRYPTSAVPVGEALDRAPWILERQPMPVSQASGDAPAGLDQVVAKVESLGIRPGWTLNVPTDPRGVFTASVYPDDVALQRVIHLDQYTVEVLFDMPLAGLGALGRAAEWGISVHMGQEYGLANQILMLLACLAIVLLAVSAAVMWWKRRPAGGLGAPRPPAHWHAPRGALAIAVVAGTFFPLVGLSLLAVLSLDVALASAMRRLAG